MEITCGIIDLLQLINLVKWQLHCCKFPVTSIILLYATYSTQRQDSMPLLGSNPRQFLILFLWSPQNHHTRFENGVGMFFVACIDRHTRNKLMRGIVCPFQCGKKLDNRQILSIDLRAMKNTCHDYSTHIDSKLYYVPIFPYLSPAAFCII